MLVNAWTLPNTATDYFLFEILRRSPLHIFSSITLLKGCKRNNFLNKISKSEAIKSTTLVIFQSSPRREISSRMSLEGLFLCWQLRLSSSSLQLYWKSSWLTALTFHKQSFQRLTGYLEGARSVQGLLFFFFFFWSCYQGASRQIQKEQWSERT